MTLLKQSSTADIFLRMVRLFSDKLSHKASLNDLLEKVFICLVMVIIIASVRQLSKCHKRITVIASRILVESHESIKGTKPFARRYSIKKMKKMSKLHWKEPLTESFYHKVTVSKLH